MSFAHQSCPKGDTGEQGLQGDQGVQGLQGTQGSPGEDAPDNFLDLVDTPDSYVDQAGKVAAVNEAENALEFIEPGGGVTDHGLLTGLGDDDHAQYALLSGRSGGQSIRGGLATTEPLTLLDGLGTQRLQLKDTSPYITLGDGVNDNTGDTVIQGKLALGNDAPTIHTYAYLNIIASPTPAAPNRGAALFCQFGLPVAVPSGTVLGIGGAAQYSADVYGTLCAGLNFEALFGSLSGSFTLAALEGIRTTIKHLGADTTTLTNGRGIHVMRPWGSAGSPRPTYIAGLYIEDQFSTTGLTTPTTIRSIKADDISGGTNRYLLELGPATPYLRLVGGADPPADQTNLFLKVAATLMNVRTKLFSALVADDRVAVFV